MPFRHCKMWQPAGDPAKSRANGFHRQLEQERSQSGSEHGNDGSRNSARNSAAEQHRRHRTRGQQGGIQRPTRRSYDESFHSEPELTRNSSEMQAKKVFDLRTGNQHRDAVGKTNDHRSWDKLHRSTHPGCTENDKYHSRHHSAHEQTIEAVHCDDAGNHYDKSAGWTSDLSFRSAE